MPHTDAISFDGLAIENAKTENGSNMLTSLDFLGEGAYWPPPSQAERLGRYRLNKSKFDNKLDFNKSAYDYIISLVDDKFRVISYRMLINFYRKVTYKTADFLFVERPKYLAPEEEKKEKKVLGLFPRKSTQLSENTKQTTLTEIVDNSKLGDIGYQGAMDVSRFGDTIYRILIEDDKAIMGITAPKYWFPVVEETDLKKIKYHVLAHTITRIVPDGNNKTKKVEFLKYQIHSIGKYLSGESMIKDGKLASGVEEENADNTVETGLSDFAIVPTHGVVTSDSIYGIDDYIDLINLIDELQIRLEKIAHVLDKHSDPSMSGPSSALTQDEETKEWSVSMGNYFQRDDKDDPDVKYITWDAQMDASFKELELLLDLIAVISEMGAAIFDRDSASGAQLSGRALKFLYINPLTKVTRYRNNFDDAFKHALSLCSEVGYGDTNKMTPQEVSIIWQDGLPNDPLEQAEIGKVRLGGASSDSVIAQIMKQDNLTIDQAEEKYAQMLNENAAQMPPLSNQGDLDDIIEQ